jgi:hypothetical protein
MERPRLVLTAKLQNDICAFIRQGGFPEVAAEAAGIPQATFRQWLARSEKPLAATSYRTFAAEVRKAAAQARVLAEMEAIKKNPLAWLKHGPGRETANMPGWTLPVRSPLGLGRGTAHALAQPELADLCAVLLRVLTPFPEARTAAAAALTGGATSDATIIAGR